MGDMADYEMEREFFEDDTFEFPILEKQYGPGPCPRCGEDTVIKEGVYGLFYRCSDFPNCRGSRYFRQARSADWKVKDLIKLLKKMPKHARVKVRIEISSV